ncbi:unnamed protein product [Mytilus coruscus]|uniref:Uncharacterized protein n=1 Tax=Mytilus coruscus TaxID=42192 RepID=A0A6J8DPJ9_MYTCO|nr:unnamed protein product [Mytilus coruscus]
MKEEIPLHLVLKDEFLYPIEIKVKIWIEIFKSIVPETDRTEIYKQRRTMEEKIIIETNVNVANGQPAVNAMWKDSNINELHCVLEVTKIEQLGVECKKQGITEKWLLNPEEINVGFVSRKLIFELRHYKRRNNVTDKTCGLWIKHICKLESIPHLGSLWLNIDRMFNKKNKMKLEERDDFLNGEYQPPLAPKEVDPNIELHCRECCKQAQVNKITCNIGKVVNEAKKITNLKKEKYEAQFQVYKLNKEKKTLSQKT